MDEKERGRALSERPKPYEVGYGRPPAEKRFRAGQSGNPKGRPRGAKTRRSGPPSGEVERMKEIILQEAYRTVQVNDPSGPVSIPIAQAIVRSLAVNAAKGHQRSQRLFTELLGTIERERKRLNDEWLEVAITYKLDWERELERREALGLSGPEPLPHPDHVHVDLRNGSVRICGPMTKEDKAEWDELAVKKAGFIVELEELEAMLRQPRCRHRDVIRDEIEHTKKVIAIFERGGF